MNELMKESKRYATRTYEIGKEYGFRDFYVDIVEDRKAGVWDVYLYHAEYEKHHLFGVTTAAFPRIEQVQDMVLDGITDFAWHYIEEYAPELSEN